MPESQAPQAATPSQAASQPQAPAQAQSRAEAPQSERKTEPARQVGTPAKKPRNKGAPARDDSKSLQEAMRAEQIAKRMEVERKNPFSRENRQSRMADVLKGLREERGVPEPREKAAADESQRETSGGSDAHHGAAQPSGQPDHGVARDAGVAQQAAPEKAAPDAASANAVPEWYKSEQKAAQALAKAEQERAASEKARSEAEAAVQRLAAAKDDPIQFMAEVGMTKEEFAAYTANGGQLTAEQKQVRAMKERLDAVEARAIKAEQEAKSHREQAVRAAEDAAFAQELTNMTYIPQMGGVQAVRQRQLMLSQSTGQPVTLRDAAQHLEQEMGQGLERLLQNPKIRSSLKLDVNTSHAGQVGEPPRTLNNSVSAQSSQEEAKPHPLDFAAKRKLWAQRVARDREAQTGR